MGHGRFTVHDREGRMLKRRKDEFIPEDVENQEEPGVNLTLIGLGVWGLGIVAYVVMVHLGLINGL